MWISKTMIIRLNRVVSLYLFKAFLKKRTRSLMHYLAFPMLFPGRGSHPFGSDGNSNKLKFLAKIRYLFKFNIKRCMANITGTPSYWHKQSKEMGAIITCKSPPHAFFFWKIVFLKINKMCFKIHFNHLRLVLENCF